jgi:CHAT domain-containing protein
MSRAAWLLVALALMPSIVGGIGVQTDDVEQASNRARRALQRGAYEDAARLARPLFAAVASQAGPDSLDAARVSDLLVEALLQNGEAADPSTLDVAQRAVAIKRAHTTERLDTAASLVNLGRVHVERGAFAAALPLHQDALSIRSQALPPGDPLVADSLDALAHTLIQMERFDDARLLLVKSLGIREPHADSAPQALARTLELQAWLFRYSGDYDRAQAPLERALAIWQRLPYDHPDLASVIQVQGDVLWLRGDIQQARAKWSEGLAVVERALRFEHPAMVGFQRRLALGANVLGYRSESRQLLDSGLRIGTRGLAPCNRELTGLRQYLASFLEYDGEYAQARQAYQQELQTIETCFGPTHSFAATVIYNQAILAADTGDFAEAERLHERAIRIWTAGLGANHPYVARGLDALAEVVAARGQPSRARTLYERALAIRRRSVGDDNPAIAWTLTNLARVSADSGNRTLAERSVTQAIDIYQRIGAADEPDHLSRALVLRGELEARRGDYAAARASFAEALSGREQIFGPTHPLTAETRTKVASADLALNFPDAALAEALAAEQAGRDHLRFTIRYLPERQAMAYAARRPRGLDLALSVVAGGHADNAAAVFDAVIRSRGVILDELAARAQSAAGAETAVADLNKAMAAARERFANLMMRSIQDGSVPAPLLDEARRQKEDAERALAEQSAAVRLELARSNAGLADVQRALPPQSALVSFVRYDRTVPPSPSPATRPPSRTTASYAAIIIRSDSDAVDVVTLGPAATLEPLVTAWREEASGRSMIAATIAQPERAYRNAGSQLRRKIWDPVADHVRSAAHTFIVPDGALNLVSFGALPVGMTRYLVEDTARIHYLSIERDLVRPADRSAAHGVLVVGGAAFDGPSPRVPSPAPAAAATRATSCTAFGSLQFSTLPQTEDEARDVARLWSAAGDDVALLTGNAAGEHAVTAAASGREIIHLATHGFFLSSRCGPAPPATRGVGGLASGPSTVVQSFAAENPLVLAGLAFAGANRHVARASGQEDGILTAEEVAGLNLQGTGWVVLSACDTGVGAITIGEGVVGLRRAFEIAGARTVIMSLWSVQDQAAREWMRALYVGRLQKHLDTADAMREASISVLRERRSHGQSTHPFYWAGFVAAGDWR